MATDLRSWATQQRAPFTLFLIGSMSVLALAQWGRVFNDFSPFVAMSSRVTSAPWSTLLYPWVPLPLAAFFGFVFAMYWLFWVGASAEREMGTPRFAAFWFVATAALALVVTGTGFLVGSNAGISGPFGPIAAVTVLWGARNPSASVRLWGILPLTGVQMAVLSGAAEAFYLGAQHPMVGLMAGLPMIATWYFGKDRFKVSVQPDRRKQKAAEFKVIKGGTKYDDSYYDDVKKREQEREERERLRKLFEGK